MRLFLKKSSPKYGELNGDFRGRKIEWRTTTSCQAHTIALMCSVLLVLSSLYLLGLLLDAYIRYIADLVR